MDKSDKILDAVENLASFMKGELADVKGELADVKGELADVKIRIDRLEANQVETNARLARIEDHLDVAELKGRVEEISRRLPIPVGIYQPPMPNKKRS